MFVTKAGQSLTHTVCGLAAYRFQLVVHSHMHDYGSPVFCPRMRHWHEHVDFLSSVFPVSGRNWLRCFHLLREIQIGSVLVNLDVFVSCDDH